MSGVTPLTSPPLSFRDFDPQLMRGHELLFFKLHGLPGQSFWYGDGGISAVSAEQILSVDLSGAIAFVANCYGGADAPMVQALIKQGVIAVVTGTGENTAGIRQAIGADIIGLAFRNVLAQGFGVEVAFNAGKLAALIRRPALKADIDSFLIVGDKHAKLSQKVKPHGSAS